MTFQSILFKDKETNLQTDEPDCFVHLNLDQIVIALTSGKEEYNLKPFYFTSLNDKEAIIYRQEILKDIETTHLFDDIKLFAQKMIEMRKALSFANVSSYKYQKERLFLDLVELYGDSIQVFAENISSRDLKSPGFISFREYLVSYTKSVRFTSLLDETKKLLAGLSSVKYCIVTKDLRVQVRNYHSEADYSAEVENVFEKFKQNAVQDYLVKFDVSQEMNHVEASILEGVASLYPDLFQHLDEYYANHTNYLDETIALFDREIQFYISWLEYIAKLKAAGLSFCYPEILNTHKDICDYEGFDVVLASMLVQRNGRVICNDFYLEGKERIIIVTGPNQGGKTTFARTFGQLHYLANIGCTVPGKDAKLFLFDKLLTHFEKEENISTHRSKFEDDLFRIHDILTQATPDSIIVMNEILSSTTLKDAIFLSKKIMEKVDSLDALCVWVTFIEELISISEKTVSMVSTVVLENPAIRTFKIVRKPADGLAYALTIAEKYRITYHHLKERLPS